MSASMHDYTTAIDKADGEQHDVCPTCGGHAETKAQTDTSGHSYTLTCQTCHWQIPLTRPRAGARDDARLVTDGGTAMQYVAECETCGIIDRGDLETVGDAVDNHEQFHTVDVKRAGGDA